MRGETATDRSLFRITGEESRDFLQNLVTNDVAGLKDGLVYAALLSPQGKYLADFFLVPHGDAVLLDIKSDLAADLLRRLTMYKLRSKVVIDEIDLPVTRGLGDTPEGAFADPRDPALGWRAYGEAGGEPATDWDAIRVARLVPETGIELQPNETYVLETGFERLRGVDFRKGCYVGQEVTARMKHKTEFKKGLARVSVEGEAEAGTQITADGKPAGVLHTRAGDEAIAYLRFDRAGGEMVAGDARITHLANT